MRLPSTVWIVEAPDGRVSSVWATQEEAQIELKAHPEGFLHQVVRWQVLGRTSAAGAPRPMPASVADTGWMALVDDMPPPHQRLLFRCENGDVWPGVMCYGTHVCYGTCVPLFRVDLPSGNSMVLNDYRGFIPTHWMLRASVR